MLTCILCFENMALMKLSHILILKFTCLSDGLLFVCEDRFTCSGLFIYIFVFFFDERENLVGRVFFSKKLYSLYR